jgi:hypothetical protein
MVNAADPSEPACHVQPEPAVWEIESPTGQWDNPWRNLESEPTPEGPWDLCRGLEAWE